MTEQPPGYQGPQGYYPPQGGYPPPGGYQSGGYQPPPPGYPAPGPYGYPPSGYMAPPAATTNGFAIASLVSSLVSCGIGSILAVIFGIIAMRQIKQTGQAGHGLALAGLIIGSLGLAAAVIYIIIMIVAVATSPSDHSTAAALIGLGQQAFSKSAPA